ncbi:hypothetical protein F4779DRAFT_593990 [Xylariaceae sp. FL0662B]|nr:hypothetical protein F4779DRAFT_593990 [Xylariaceae sp. FL0662B]
MSTENESCITMTTTMPRNQEPRWVSPIPTPSYGAGGSTSIICSTSIAASPSMCLEIMLDTTTYPSWNRWIPRVLISTPNNSAPSMPATLAHLASKPEQMLLPDTKFTFEVHLDSQVQHSDLIVTVLNDYESDGRKGLRVCWKTRNDPWYLRAERTQDFLEGTDGETDYFCYETFYGPVAWVVKTFFGSALTDGFKLWMEGLKKAAEEKAKVIL